MFVLFWKAQTPHAGKGTGKLLVKKGKFTIGKLSCILSQLTLIVKIVSSNTCI